MSRDVTSRSIRSLKPNVTREQAIRYFSDGAMNRIADVVRGRVRSLAELYIPFRLFQVTIVSAGRVQIQTLALDAVRGALDLYRFPEAASGEQFFSVESRNVVPTGLDEKQAAEQLVAQVRRMVFARGFFRVRQLKIEAIPLSSGEICVPYWVCFRGPDERVHLAVMDAVRRKPEGAKVRRLVEEWLRSESGISEVK